MSERQRQEYVDDFKQLSPFGSLRDKANRQNYILILATLREALPDYDISIQDLKPKAFSLVPSYRLPTIRDLINNTIWDERRRRGGVGRDLLNPPVSPGGSEYWSYSMWTKIDEQMSLGDCEIYQPAEGVDLPGYESPLWRFAYFFINKHLKRVCYLTVCAMTLADTPAVTPRRSQSLGGDDEIEIACSLPTHRHNSSETGGRLKRRHYEELDDGDEFNGFEDKPRRLDKDPFSKPTSQGTAQKPIDLTEGNFDSRNAPSEAKIQTSHDQTVGSSQRLFKSLVAVPSSARQKNDRWHWVKPVLSLSQLDSALDPPVLIPTQNSLNGTLHLNKFKTI